MKNIFKTFWPFAITIAVFIICLAIFLSKYEKFDGHIVINQYHNKFGDVIFRYLTLIGDGYTAGCIIIILLLWRLELGITALIAFAFTAGITQSLKLFVYEDVERPFLAMWEYFHSNKAHLVEGINIKVANSFPSGHTASAMSIFCFLAIVCQKKWFSFSFACLAISASFSRIYLSQHFAEDVLTGTLIGVIGTFLMYFLFAEKLKQKFYKYPSGMKRAFDILTSILVLIIGLPFFLIISLLIITSSKGGVFFSQERIGLNKKPFKLYKFRTMKPDSEKQGQITIGGKDNRITKIGYYLRKFKLDEFPQLINVIKGDMSIVGPRPEVRKYVELYSDEQLKVLTVRPGLTDFASIEFIDENEILGNAENPNLTYIEEILPHKLNLNLKYIKEQSFKLDIILIFRTFRKIF